MKKTTIKAIILVGMSLPLAIASSAVLHAKTRFVVVGDTGTGKIDQDRVAKAIKSWRAKGHPIDFVLLAGDNFYPRGLRTYCSLEKFLTLDQQNFRTKFLDIYKDLKLSFFPVLGNHDYSAACTCNTLKCPEKDAKNNLSLRDYLNKNCTNFYGMGGGDVFNPNVGSFQFDRLSEDDPTGDCSLTSENADGSTWDMPTSSDYAITKDQQNDFVVMALDTTPMVAEEWEILDSGATIGDPKFHVEKVRFAEFIERQADEAFEELKNSSANWKIAFGHHPFVSNGDHGTAGRYDVSADTLGKCIGIGNCCSVNSADPVPGRYAVDQPDQVDKPGADKHDEGGGWHCGWRLRQFLVGGAQRRFTEGLNPIPGLCDAGLDVYFSGHDHLLQVSAAQCSNNRRIPFIVSGGGGAGSYTPTLKPSEPQSWSARAWSRHGFVYVEINGLHMDVTLVGASKSATVDDELQHCDVDKMGRDMPPTIKCDRPLAKPTWEQCDQVTQQCLGSP